MPPVVSNMNLDDSFAIRQSDWIDARVLSPAGAAESFQAPALAKFVLFSANGDFYCQITPVSNGSAVAATVPAGDVTDGTASELNPAIRMLPSALDYISLISPTGGATIVTMNFFRS